MWLHEDQVFRKLNGTKCCKAAKKATTLLQLGSRTDGAATFTSHATG